mgnify:CR=1 FL=1
MTTHNSILPRFYGLPKVHKENFPLQPVMSFTKSPLYQISSFLAGILNGLRNENINTRSPLNLIQRLQHITLGPDDVFVSFDIVAMYTNIPVELALNVVDQR